VLFFAGLLAILLAFRLCHLDILWADEDYHQAAAIQIQHGKVLYRDLWYDKPPLNAAVYLLFDAQGGAILRAASAVYALLLCATAFLFARRLWSEREGRIAAALSAFFLIFYFPGATITLEPDTLLLLPHLWAIYFASQRRFLAAGLLVGLGLLFNVKALFVLAACVVLCLNAGWISLLFLAAGIAIPTVATGAWLAAHGAMAGYIDQVWLWGFLYAGSPESSGSLFAAGFARAGNWAAFHAALVLGAVYCAWKDSERRLLWISWTALSLAAAAVGWRFLPRYLDQLLPPLIIAAARGIALIHIDKRRVLQAILSVALLVPAVRFAPRYAILATEILRGTPHAWADTAMDRDSRAASRMISALAGKHSTLFVWGYRPNLYVYTKLASASRFWDSQPLTGVPADRHLSNEYAVAPEWARANREELVHSHPDFIADGLSLYNPRLEMRRYPELADWLAQYCEVGRTSGTVVYRKCR
jgi:hypothetical protein